MSENNTSSQGHAPTKSIKGMPALMLKLAGVAPFEGGEIQKPRGAVRILAAHSSAYIVPVNGASTEYMLIDSGQDPKGEELISVLQYLGAGIDSVKAILLTHAHQDHSSGAHLFPLADVYIGAGDRDFMEGKGTSGGLIGKMAGAQPELAVADVSKLHTISQDQTIQVGEKIIRVFMVPGHTRGSLAYLVDNVLFIGDAVVFKRNGKAGESPRIAVLDPAKNIESLRRLLEVIDKESLKVDLVVPNHSGTGSLDAVRELVRRKSK